MTHLPPNRDRSIATLTLDDLEAIITSIVEKILQQEKPNRQSEDLPTAVIDRPYDATARPFWEIVTQLATQVSKQEWADVPSDASEKLDDYFYGNQSPS
ncbi:MAG: hypothetical protein RIM23_20570 [Coleofasciculus sp. G3-WIS-01]|uniref:hypothetical protein n=1 Tax=Coleofasciculus sp. G3-WIS-01 TaxID=3069528 RepID=UPI003303263D